MEGWGARRTRTQEKNVLLECVLEKARSQCGWKEVSGEMDPAGPPRPGRRCWLSPPMGGETIVKFE